MSGPTQAPTPRFKRGDAILTEHGAQWVADVWTDWQGGSPVIRVGYVIAHQLVWEPQDDITPLHQGQEWTLVFTERKTVEATIEIRAHGDTPEAAAEVADRLYAQGAYDTALEDADATTEACEIHCGYYHGETYVRLW